MGIWVQHIRAMLLSEHRRVQCQTDVGCVAPLRLLIMLLYSPDTIKLVGVMWQALHDPRAVQ